MKRFLQYKIASIPSKNRSAEDVSMGAIMTPSRPAHVERAVLCYLQMIPTLKFVLVIIAFVIHRLRATCMCIPPCKTRNPISSRPLPYSRIRTRRLITVTLGLCTGVMSMAQNGDAADHYFFVFSTRLGGTKELATPYLTQFAQHVSAECGWPNQSMRPDFLITPNEVLDVLAKRKPDFAVLEPFLFYELQRAHKLKNIQPVATVVSKELVYKQLYLVVSSPSLQTLADLRGKKIASSLKAFSTYLNEVVFENKLNVENDLQIVPVRNLTKAIRWVVEGKVDGVLIDELQQRHMKEIQGGSGLRAIYKTKELPPMVVIAFTSQMKTPDRNCLSRTLSNMCTSIKGTPLCKEMRIQAFAPLPVDMHPVK